MGHDTLRHVLHQTWDTSKIFLEVRITTSICCVLKVLACGKNKRSDISTYTTFLHLPPRGPRDPFNDIGDFVFTAADCDRQTNQGKIANVDNEDKIWATQKRPHRNDETKKRNSCSAQLFGNIQEFVSAVD